MDRINAIAVTLALLALAGCQSRPKENWNSYYYGGYQEVNGKFEYTGKNELRDNDDNYVSPNIVNDTSSGVAAPTTTQIR